MPTGSVESMCSSVPFTREAEATEITDAISELSYLAARKSKVAAELRKLGHLRCELENEHARILRREAMAASLIEGTWEYEKKKKKLAAELDEILSAKPSQAPEEKTKQLAAQPCLSTGAPSASRSTRPVSPKIRPSTALKRKTPETPGLRVTSASRST